MRRNTIALSLLTGLNKKKVSYPSLDPRLQQNIIFFTYPLVFEQLWKFQLKSSVHSMTLLLFLRKAEQPWQSVNCHRWSWLIENATPGPLKPVPSWPHRRITTCFCGSLMKAPTSSLCIPPFSLRLLQQPSSYLSLSGTCLKHMLSKCLVKKGQLEENATLDIVS